MIKRHETPAPGRRRAARRDRRRRDRASGPDPRLQRRARSTRKDNRPTRVGIERVDGKAFRDLAPHEGEDRLMAASPAARSRLKSRYDEEIRPALIERFGYSTPMQAPEIKKITLNMGVGDAKQDTKALEAATEQLATIAGQRPNVRRARKSIAAFKLREGMPVGVVGDAARRAQLRVPRPPDVDRDPADPRLPRHEPALVRRPRQLLAGRARADHLPRDRLRRDRPDARPRHHDHDQRPAPTSRRSRCSRRSGSRSRTRGGRRAWSRRGAGRRRRLTREWRRRPTASAADGGGGRRSGAMRMSLRRAADVGAVRGGAGG